MILSLAPSVYVLYLSYTLVNLSIMQYIVLFHVSLAAAGANSTFADNLIGLSELFYTLHFERII